MKSYYTRYGTKWNRTKRGSPVFIFFGWYVLYLSGHRKLIVCCFFTLYKTISLWVKLQRKCPYFFVVRLKKRKLQSKEPLTVLASPSFVCLDRHSVFSISSKKLTWSSKFKKYFSGSETDHSLVLLSAHLNVNYFIILHGNQVI